MPPASILKQLKFEAFLKHFVNFNIFDDGKKGYMSHSCCAIVYHDFIFTLSTTTGSESVPCDYKIL